MHGDIFNVGLDCSLDLENPFWLTVPSIPPKNFTSSKFARASHSAVLWRQNDMLVYGGYQFPHNGYSSLHRLDNETYTMVNNGNSSNAGTDEVLIYHIESGVWEAVVTSGSEYGNSSIPVIPSPRYGHTSILYNVSCVHALRYRTTILKGNKLLVLTVF